MLAKLYTKSPWGGPWHDGAANKDGTGTKDADKKSPEEKEGEAKKKEEGKSRNPWESSAKKKPESAEFDIDESIKKIKESFSKLFRGSNNGGSGGGGFGNQNNNPIPKSFIGLVTLGLIVVWLFFGFYKVDSDENAVVLYFGKFHSISSPGLNYSIPYPIGRVIKRSIMKVNTEEFGFSTSKNIERNFEAESLMLTGDENIVDIEFQLQWQISDIKDFVFNIAEQNNTIRKSAESAMREIIARTPIANALSDGKKKIEQDAKQLLQEILDSYNAGVHVVLVQLLRVDPPIQVRDAFLDVQAAKADKEKEINQAQSYANDIIPRARGTAAQMKENASAYSQEVVTRAQGEAGRFMSVYRQYTKSKSMTKRRIYIETMEQILRDMDKVFIDKSSARSAVMPYFPIDEISKKEKKK